MQINSPILRVLTFCHEKTFQQFLRHAGGRASGELIELYGIEDLEPEIFVRSDPKIFVSANLCMNPSILKTYQIYIKYILFHG